VDLAQEERIVARFVQEARTAATLSGHPNIVPIFDIGEQNGLYFLIMQYVEGEDLSKHLKRRRKLTPKEAAKIVCQVADALVWASGKGVVHRDLKPSNLYLDQNDRVMVLDFGISKAADVPSPLTFATERLGTTYYMSPEQIRGENCDVRSDLYSLGVVFFELLSGRKPSEPALSVGARTGGCTKPVRNRRDGGLEGGFGHSGRRRDSSHERLARGELGSSSRTCSGVIPKRTFHYRNDFGHRDSNGSGRRGGALSDIRT
jgi:serine/threonine protein kinase